MRLLLLLLSTIVSVFAYMNEPYPPFIITSPKLGQQIKRGDTVNVTWELSPGVRFPLYGYAASRTARTVAGLLPPDASKHERYTQNIETHLQFTDYEYEWLVDDTVTPGSYQLGIGFYYHEVSPTFHIMP
ncbi:hypothetical protein LRAMOSA07946 [Lichtheimia ramosa]|uniref:Uncharacterized protein n=1 Tax=Lichtheimia ramosa TaxID=688394 RepID=A0A077WE71_9FUNG|nr:hypothetical protein LRAMOSA07946 [Lichtheimia ramosa]